jgi:hypothetical protein
MASESGVSTGEWDEGIPSEGHMTESDVPVVQKGDHANGVASSTREGHSEVNAALIERDVCVAGTVSNHQSEGHVSGSPLKDQGQGTENGGHLVDDSDDEDTAGEFGDCLPQDSTSTATTDAFNEPVDFIETRPHNHTHSFNGTVLGRGVLRASPAIHYANWSELAELTESSKRGNIVGSSVSLAAAVCTDLEKYILSDRFPK